MLFCKKTVTSNFGNRLWQSSDSALAEVICYLRLGLWFYIPSTMTNLCHVCKFKGGSLVKNVKKCNLCAILGPTCVSEGLDAWENWICNHRKHIWTIYIPIDTTTVWIIAKKKRAKKARKCKECKICLIQALRWEAQPLDANFWDSRSLRAEGRAFT